MTRDAADLIELGTVIEAYGIRGALKVRPFSSDPVALLAAKEVWLTGRAFTSAKDFSVFLVKEHSGSVILELVGLTDRELALTYKSALVCVPRSKFPSLPDDEYYWTDLIGVPVYNLQEEFLGTVTELVDNSAQTVLVVKADPLTQYLIPFVNNFVIDVHVMDSPKKIIVDWQKDW